MSDAGVGRARGELRERVAWNTASSRRRRADSLRSMSVSRLVATVSSQPRGLSGMPPAGHCGRGVEQRLLHGVLAAVQAVVAAHEHAEDLRREFAQQVLGARGVWHRGQTTPMSAPVSLEASCRIGHTSVGWCTADGSSAAISSARCSLSTSSRYQLARYSLVSR